jgi:hypothetical protein
MSSFSSVHPHGCTLSWKKPLDDGGSPLTSYIIEKKDLDKDIWISCGTFVARNYHSLHNSMVNFITKKL